MAEAQVWSLIEELDSTCYTTQTKNNLIRSLSLADCLQKWLQCSPTYIYLLGRPSIVLTLGFSWLCFANRILTNLSQVTVWERLPTEVSLLAVFKTLRLPREWIQVGSRKAMWWRCRCPVNKLPTHQACKQDYPKSLCCQWTYMWPQLIQSGQSRQEKCLTWPQNDELYETITVLHFGMFSYIAKAGWHIILTFVLCCLFYLLFQVLLLHNELP